MTKRKLLVLLAAGPGDGRPPSPAGTAFGDLRAAHGWIGQVLEMTITRNRRRDRCTKE